MRALKCFAAIIASLMIYALITFVPAATFTFLNAPVGGGKVGAVAIVYYPAALLALGWMQGKRIFKMHLIAVSLIAFEAWRFQAFFNPNHHVGTLSKEWPYHVFTIAALSYGLCALTTALRNAWNLWHGSGIELRVPIYGKVALITSRAQE